MTAQSFTYSGNIYTGATAGTVDFALTSTGGNPILYLEKAHIHVYKSTNQGSTWTELTRPSQWDFVSSGTVARLVTGISAGEWVKVQRITPSLSSYVTFQASSLLTAEQLNSDTLFNTYLNQERFDQGSQSDAIATAASTAAASATSTANTALSNSTAAQSSAASAVSTANAANATSASALSTATAANTTANAANSTANTASTTASNAVTTANTASSLASGAVTTANAADVKADAAIAAVASSVNYTSVANVASIPASPANNTYIEVANSTGLENFTPLAGMPGGFVGDSGLRVRLRYTTTGATWNWIDYAPTDADGRYVAKASISSSTSSTSTTTVANSAAVKTAKDAADSAQSTANAALPKAGGTMTGNITFNGGQTFPGAVTSVSGTSPVSVTAGTTPTVSVSAASTSASGVVQLSDSTSTNDSTKAATSAAVKSVQDFAQVVSTTANAALPKAGGVMTGELGIVAGTAGAPGLYPTGDPNTGIYSPGADQVALATNGSARLYVSSTGSVGIATTSPYSLLDLGTSLAGQKLSLYASATSRVGLGVLNNEFRQYVNDAGSITFGHLSTSDQTTFSERARIDSSGRLLVGTGSAYLVEGFARHHYFNPRSGDNSCNVVIGSQSTGSIPGIFFTRTRAAAANLATTAVADGDNLGSIRFFGANGTDFSNCAGMIECFVDGQPFTSGDTTDLPGRLVFYTTADGAGSPTTERMRIDSAGNTILQTAGAYVRIKSASTDFDISGQAGATDFIRINANGTQRFQFDAAGRAYNSTGTWGTISDVRLKENIADASSKIEDVKSLRVVNYNLLSDPGVKQIGFIAQEIEQVFPSLVEETGTVHGVENAKAVKTTVLIPVLVKALQEAIAKIETLEAKVAALEAA